MALDAMIAAGHEVRICTSPLTSNPTCASDKLAWVREHLGEDWVRRVIIAKDKTWVRGDLLIDDRPSVDGSLTPTWQHIIFDAPYNQTQPGRRLQAWSDWESVLTKFGRHRAA